jgi:hypothetical protein
MTGSQSALRAICFCLGAVQLLSAEQKQRLFVGTARAIMPAVTGLGTVSATPSTISFTSTNPDSGTVSGSSSATVSWTTSGGSSSSTWNLKVQAAASSFTSCATIPTSAVTVTCNSVSGGSSGACKSAVTLSSTTAQQVASGKESTSTNAPYSVTLNFTLTDSWEYIANSSCTLSLTYTVTAP